MRHPHPHTSRPRTRRRRLPAPAAAAALASAALAAGCAAVHAASEPLDCSIPVPEVMIRDCPTRLYASEIEGCLASERVDRHTCLVMDDDVEFCEGAAPMPLTVVFDRSDRTLDCNGGAIDHGVRRTGSADDEVPVPEATSGNGRHPAVHFVRDRSLSGITVRECGIRRTGHGGIVAQRLFHGQLDANGLDAEGRPPLGHHDLLFEDLEFDDTEQALYLGNYSRDVTMRRLDVDGTRRIAIYSEAGSRGLTIEDSVFANNRTRETIALDSTQDSTIANNLFVNNREGGINLYLNCGELKGTVCPIVRDTPPNGNRISDNRFVHNGITGVQVASRQGRRHSTGWCATLDGRAGRHTDTAEDNTVENNLFVCDEGTAIVAMDGPNRIAGNRVVARERCVPYEISTGGLGRDAAPLLDGLELEGNEIDATRPPRLRNVGPGVSVR